METNIYDIINTLLHGVLVISSFIIGYLLARYHIKG